MPVSNRLAKPTGDRYVGEKKNQLRHGHGVYQYENKFYRYEGQWKNGYKHGHGKLIMKDGGYYEGTFDNGEIEGHGYKVFGISGATYTGQFHRGEMHGQGLMRRPSGEQYEGCWQNGKRHGLGIMTGSDGSIYEGYFHENMKHEQGVQIYSNGDQYEGDWVMGKRHGHGMLRCADGTLYDGQWKNGIFHGEGRMSHSSGVMYHGMWINGRPQHLGVKLRLAEENDVIFVEQGKTFDINIECVDEEGNVADFESGRLFKVVATIRKVTRSITRARSRLLSDSSTSTASSKSETLQKSIPTPFGYSTLPYELLQVPGAATPTPDPSISTQDQVKSIQLSPSKKIVTFDSEESYAEGIKPSSPMVLGSDSTQSSQIVTDNLQQGKAIDDKLNTSSSTNLVLHSASQQLSPPWSRKRSGSIAIHRSQDGTQSVVLSKSEDTLNEFGSQDEEFLAGLIEPELISTKDGQATIKELFLPPPPAPNITHIVTPTLNTKKSPTGSRASIKSPNLRSVSPRGLAVSPRHSGAVASQSSSVKSGKRRSTEGESQLALKSKEKLFQPKREKYCAAGSYVMIISEVTTPPYFGHFADLHVEVTVVPHRIGQKEVSIDKLLLANRKRRGSSLAMDSDKIPRARSKLLTQNKMN